MRCFVAIELTDGVRRQLGALQQKMAAMSRSGALDRAVRWVRPEQMHLTLKFLGEVAAERVPAVCSAVAQVALAHEPIRFGVRGTGWFPPRGGPRVLWVGVDEPSGVLAGLHEACDEALGALGFARESRAFSPHLTLGRVKESAVASVVRDAATAAADFDAGTVLAEEIVVFQSILSRGGATYHALARASFATGS